MQKIREVGGEAYSYASDYEIIGKIKQFADKHGICVLTVQHTRKQPDGDAFEMISGTTGLLGCADGSLGGLTRICGVAAGQIDGQHECAAFPLTIHQRTGSQPGRAKAAVNPGAKRRRQRAVLPALPHRGIW